MCMMMPMMMASHQETAPQPTAHHEPPPTQQISALELLKVRYVKGEITRAEFEEMRQVLADTK